MVKSAEKFNDELAGILEMFIAKFEEEDPMNVNTLSLQVTNTPQDNGVTYVIRAEVTVTFDDEEESD